MALSALSGCVTPASPPGATPGFTLDQRHETTPVVPPSGQAPDRQAVETPPDRPVAAPTPAGLPAGAGSGGAAPSAPSSFLMLADGRRIEVPAAGEVTLPPGLTGEVSLFVPGRVPSTVLLAGPGAPSALHPRTDSPPGAPTAV
ncbi:MAG: hypothetical protein ACK46X_10530, partial [Candidatus Sericytochromatia bacterium]